MSAEDCSGGDGSSAAKGLGPCAGSTSVDAGAARSRCIELLCEGAEEFVELIVDGQGNLSRVSATLARRLGRSGTGRKDFGLTDVLSASGRAWLTGEHAVSSGPRVLHFIDASGDSFSARVIAFEVPAGIHLLGILTSACDANEQRLLHSLNNELAVTSRELARQRRQLETLVEQARGRELELLSAYQTIEKVARTDPLTGLANRRVLDEDLPRVLQQAGLAKNPVSVLVLDLDHFKQVNDLFGHDVGDQVLAEVAAVLRRNTRDSDLAVRLGGEELMLVLPGVAEERAIALANDLRHGIALISLSGVDWRVTASIGVACWTGGEESLPLLLARADAAMYRAKADGRDRCVVADPST